MPLCLLKTGRVKPIDTKATDIDLTLSLENQFCKNFADGSRVFNVLLRW
jgi:hypothetical protein